MSNSRVLELVARIERSIASAVGQAPANSEIKSVLESAAVVPIMSSGTGPELLTCFNIVFTRADKTEYEKKLALYPMNLEGSHDVALTTLVKSFATNLVKSE